MVSLDSEPEFCWKPHEPHVRPTETHLKLPEPCLGAAWPWPTQRVWGTPHSMLGPDHPNADSGSGNVLISKSQSPSKANPPQENSHSQTL
jgi:hypothetical protein